MSSPSDRRAPQRGVGQRALPGRRRPEDRAVAFPGGQELFPGDEAVAIGVRAGEYGPGLGLGDVHLSDLQSTLRNSAAEIFPSLFRSNWSNAALSASMSAIYLPFPRGCGGDHRTQRPDARWGPVRSDDGRSGGRPAGSTGNGASVGYRPAHTATVRPPSPIEARRSSAFFGGCARWRQTWWCSFPPAWVRVHTRTLRRRGPRDPAG